MAAAHDVLLSVRVELHRRTGKAIDRLLLQDQDGVAAALGDADADVLMARVAAAARTVAWTSDDTWDRIRSSLRGPVGRMAARDRVLGPGLVLRDGRVELAADADPAGDPGPGPAGGGGRGHGRGVAISRSALNRLAAEAVGPGDPWPDEARRVAGRPPGAGRAAIPVLEALDQKGLLTRLLPEWSAVSSRPQRNAYHRFTVDRHLCEAAANAAALTGRVAGPTSCWSAPGCTTWARASCPSWATTTASPAWRWWAGSPPAWASRRPTWPCSSPSSATTCCWPTSPPAATSTTRPPSAAVAAALGDPGTVELLHALTEADSLATGPAAWSAWKAGLVSDLAAHADCRPSPAGERPSGRRATVPARGPPRPGHARPGTRARWWCGATGRT